MAHEDQPQHTHEGVGIRVIKRIAETAGNVVLFLSGIAATSIAMPEVASGALFDDVFDQ